jgi:uncharacterized membrane protein
MTFFDAIPAAGYMIEAVGVLIIVADTLENVAILGLIILIRSFLSVTLHLEVEGRWPWETEPNTRG